MGSRKMLLLLSLLTVALAPRGVRAAVSPTDSLLAVVRTSKSKPQQVLALLALSQNYRLADSTRAYRFAAQAVSMARQYVDTLAARALLSFGSAYKVHGRYDQALTCFQQGLAKAQSLGQTPDIAQGYREIANAQMMQGRFPESLAALRAELPLRRKLKNNDKLAGLFNNFGNLYYRQGDYPTSLHYYLLSLKIAEQVNDLAQIALTSANISGLYAAQKDHTHAVAYLERTISLHRTLRDTLGLAAHLADMGKLYADSEEYPKAQQYLKQSIHLRESLGKKSNVIEQAKLYYYLGKLQAQQKQHTLALSNLAKAEKILRPLHLPAHLLVVRAAMAQAYQATGQPGLAQQAAQEALALAQQMGANNYLEDAYQTLADVSAANGNFADAYTYRQRYEAFHDSVFSAEKAQQIAALQSRYDLRNKENQIVMLRHSDQLLRSTARAQYWFGGALAGALLLASLLGISWYRRYHWQRRANQRLQAQELAIAAQNEDLRKTQQRLRESLGEKDVLLQEVHHRVKNNLQIIASLFALQAYEHPNVPLLSKALQEGQSRIQAIALTHELMYQSSDLTRIEFQPFLEKLSEYLAKAFAHPSRLQQVPAGVISTRVPQTFAAATPAVKVEVHASGVHFSTNTAVPLGLITNELLSNAYKHAFTDGRPGYIKVTLSPPDESGLFTLTVADNGVGLPARFSLKSASSLGLRLVSSLAKQLGGTFQAEHTRNGSCFRITFREEADN